METSEFARNSVRSLPHVTQPYLCSARSSLAVSLEHPFQVRNPEVWRQCRPRKQEVPIKAFGVRANDQSDSGIRSRDASMGWSHAAAEIAAKKALPSSSSPSVRASAPVLDRVHTCVCERRTVFPSARECPQRAL